MLSTEARYDDAASASARARRGLGWLARHHGARRGLRDGRFDEESDAGYATGA